MLPAPISVQSIDDIDLDRHAVIEASAGTGKTYCIENLVVRLLCEKEIPLDKILLVTFTEKATGDLHSRIRENIMKALKEGRGRAEFLRDALESFDTASIHTIHGFCQRTLMQYAFENGGHFKLEMVDDPPLFRTLLREQQRRDWPTVYGEKLEPLLQLSGYPGSVGDGESSWERRVLELATRYRPEAGDRLLPEPIPDPDIDGLDALVAEAFEAISAIVGVINDPEDCSFVRAYNRLPMNQATQGACVRRVLIPLLDLVELHSREPQGVIGFFQLVEQCREYPRFEDFRFAVLTSSMQWNRVDASDSFVGQLEQVVEILDQLAADCHVLALQHQLSSDTVMRLKRAAREFKEERGLISFDDMLLLMAQTLEPAVNRRADQMLEQLRGRYRYALVDEFQDTDPVQWQIFQRIFLGTPDHFLFVIGDPKQAIYSFRGADLHMYVEAKELMLAQHGAALYNLPTNWRSTASMIGALNRLCADHHWFTPGGRVDFNPVQAPPVEQRRSQLYVDRSRRAALTVVDLDKPKRRASHARLWMAKFVADEVARLLGDRHLEFSGDSGRRRLVASDICILVRKASEAEPIEEALAREGIAYAYYKKGGLYESNEAKQLYYLFQAIAAPGDIQAIKKALMTRFFGFKPADLAGDLELGPEHPVRRSLQLWNEHASKRRWPELFQAILEQTRLVYEERKKPDGERRITNYRHILQDLVTAAIDKSLDLAGVIDVVRNYKEHRDLMPDGADMHRQESELPKVQIMTIHTSKGLEFPVVFLAGGFTRGMDNDYWMFHDDAGKRVYDLARSPASRDMWAAEQSEEDLRLYYVALTRAIYKLYVPRFRPDERTNLAGPVSHFLYSALENAFEQHDNPDVRHIDVRGFDKFTRDELPVIEAEQREEERTIEPLDLSAIALPPQQFHFAHRMNVVGSFSAFAHRSAFKKDAMSLMERLNSFTEESTIREEEALTIEEFLPEGNVRGQILPPGADTGTMLHHVFENTPFQRVSQMQTSADLLACSVCAKVIDESLEAAAIPGPEGGDTVAWRGEVAHMVFNALKTPLLDGFALSQLAPDDCIHEMEFFFPATTQGAVEDIELRDGYLLGYIDLIFRFEGKYYILDWKSNYLKKGYGQEELEDCMDEANYHLQYKVYTMAVAKWLQRVVPGFDIDQDFGGVFYLFVRGMRPQSKDGIFYHEFGGLPELASYAMELNDLFGAPEEAHS